MILNADARAIPLAAGSVHCVVTSPPYWGLRDYGTATWVGGDPECGHVERNARNDVSAADLERRAAEYATRTGAGSKVSPMQFRGVCRKCGAIRHDAQLGLERTPEEYVASLVAVFREVWRVLRDDGTLWLNLGDSYATAGGAGYQGKNGQRADRTFTQESLRHRDSTPGLKPKDLVGIPWRVAFALQADGWYLRSDIVWSKPNPMPESITDRPTKAHEYVFLLAKRERYYYDAESIKEPTSSSIIRLQQPTFDRQTGGPKDFANGTNPNRSARRALRNLKGRAMPPQVGDLPEQWAALTGRNRRSVWEIATQPYPEAHFATFPEALVEPCVLAGTSERGVCRGCGAPWERIVEKKGGSLGASWHDHSADGERGQRIAAAMQDKSHGRNGHEPYSVTTGWQPTCACAAPTTQPLVLDPFAGSGTVGQVCHRLGRRFVGLELKPDYCRMAYRRTAQLGLV